jgi:hypothetical protein
LVRARPALNGAPLWWKKRQRPTGSNRAGVRIHLLSRRDINALNGLAKPPEIDPRQLSLGGCLA